MKAKITYLQIFNVTVKIISPTEISDWINHDYHRYVALFNPKEPELVFNLQNVSADINRYGNLITKSYHKDYLIYEKENLRIIDFFSEALSVFNKKTRETYIYCPDLNYLYEIFYLAFESLVGEELERKGYIRIHCLALEKNNQASILMLPPGGGKTTLALKFLKHPEVKVLAEDILLFKNKKFYGLNFRWGIRSDDCDQFEKRLMSRRKENKKYLIDTQKLSLAAEAACGNLIIGIRQIGQDCQIIKISKLKIFKQMFKPMVLGLELQQSLAYFLLNNPFDHFSKFELIAKRLFNIIRIIANSKCYNIYLGHNIEKNFQTLDKFLNKTL